MLRTISTINGYQVTASDGKIGTVSDFLFDDITWKIRWLVVDMGDWLTNRQVLLPPSALESVDPEARTFTVNLTKQQIEDSPDITTERPVSRQTETSVYNYYGWSPYWGSGFYMGGYGYVPPDLAASAEIEARQQEEERLDNLSGIPRSRDNPNLRSSAAITGYHIHALDGEIGHVEDFLLDDEDWSIHYLVIDTKNWWPGKKVLILPRTVEEIDWTESLVDLNIKRSTITDSPPYDSTTIIDADYEENFLNYYGGHRPGGYF